MTTLFIGGIFGGVLVGSVLSRFFTVLVLLPVCTSILAAVVISSMCFGNGLPHPILQFAALSTALQLGYFMQMLSPAAPAVLQAFRKGGMKAHPASPHPATREPS
jgi:hypothetical protein